MKKVLKPFKFGTMKTAADFEKTMTEAGLPFPVDENVDILAKPIQIGDRTVPTRLCIQPLEGFDGEPDGSPSDLIRRRYKRYAGGGAGMIWYESIAISEDGRCNPLQMVIRPSTVQSIREMVEEANAEAIKNFGRRPYNVLQLTHSGRRSNNKQWQSTPLAVCENPYMDDHNSIDGSSGKITIASDDKIEEIIRRLKTRQMMDCIVVKEDVSKEALKKYGEDTVNAVGATWKQQDVFGYELNFSKLEQVKAGL